jgi:CheY-like chemotaxis protein
VESALDGEEGLFLARYHGFDMIILDFLLPGMDGLTLLKKLREGGNQTHVLILSAKDQVSDRVEGLRLGADDYLVKPFSFEELNARISALVRRGHHHKNPDLQVGGLRVNTYEKKGIFARTTSCVDSGGICNFGKACFVSGTGVFQGTAILISSKLRKKFRKQCGGSRRPGDRHRFFW